MGEQEIWTAKDAGLGVLFITFGLLVTFYSLLAMKNGYPLFLWGLGWLVGPLLVILGGNAIFRVGRSLWRKRGST